MSNTIEQQIEINAPVSRVWQALTNHVQFGEWFRVKLDGPFVPGEPSTGHMTYPGYEHIQWNAVVQDVKPEHLFSFTWHPYAIEPDVDYSSETPTLIEFTLEAVGSGTLVKVTESGFDNIPESRREEAFRMDSGGWEAQVQNIKTYVESPA